MVPTAIIVLGFVRFAAVASRQLNDLSRKASISMVSGPGWYYSLIAAGFVRFILLMAFGPHRNATLDPDNKPFSYSLVNQFTMLFTVGMGIGLIF